MSELDKLEKWLNENAHHYGWIINRHDREYGIRPVNEHRIHVYRHGEFQFSAICQFGSYGYEYGLLEIAGNLTGGGVEGWLTANDVIRKIKEKEEKT